MSQIIEITTKIPFGKITKIEKATYEIPDCIQCLKCGHEMPYFLGRYECSNIECNCLVPAKDFVENELEKANKDDENA